MKDPWLQIPLSDYESHMSDVLQLDALSILFGEALERCHPRSVAILGIAGGNGLERIDPAITTRVVGLDLNRFYLDAVKHRYGHLPGLELHEVDLAAGPVALPPVDLVHAALIFEHTGVDCCLDNAISLVAPGGHLSVVLQLAYGRPGQPRIRDWPLHFTIVDPVHFQSRVGGRGLTIVHERKYPVPAGEFWAAIFAKS